MKTPLVDSPAKERLLAAAEAVMVAKGYPAATVDEICAAAGLTKGSFFHYFKSKEDIAAAALETVWERRKREVFAAPFFQKKDPWERLSGYLDFVREAYANEKAHRECLMGCFALELGGTHPELHSRCRDKFIEWIDLLERELKSAKEILRPKKFFEPRAVAEHMVAAFEGAMLLSRAHNDWSFAQRDLEQIRVYLSALFGK